MIAKLLCMIGWHRWERKKLGGDHVRTCARCDKKQYFSFTDYYGEWRDL